ncbi:MAG: uroporphyrinogen-III synthase [Planctomycetaceae bacterium]|jgi:uroporphyrinogen III methyltransferase/synthase|nr:uroporphyrinogen-III synthase [Planctomycetaceae bacterium]
MPTVLLTRPKHLIKPLQTDLELLGWTVLLQPTIEICPPDSWVPVDDAIRRIICENHHEKNGFDWLVFSSVNGIQFFFDRDQFLKEEKDEPDKTTFGILQKQPEFLKPIRIAVIGAETGAALQRRIGRRADILPEIFSIEGALEHLLKEAQSGKRFLLLRANRGREILRQRLQEAGGIVTEVVVYKSVDVKHPSPEIAEAMRLGNIHYITVTSSAIACSLVKMFGNNLRQCKLVSISPITSKTLRELGFPPQYEAKIASMKGIIDVLRPFSPNGNASILDSTLYNELLGRQHQ